MAGSDDDIEKLLRDVEATLGGKNASPAKRDERRPGTAASGGPSGASASSMTDRLEQAALPAVAIGTLCAAPVWVAFSILPFVDGISGGIGAFAAGFSVSFVGRLRRG